MPPKTFQDLIVANGKLADSILEQAASVNRLVPVLQRLQHDIHTLLTNYDLDKAAQDLVQRDIHTKLAVILDNLKDTEDQIQAVQRDVTNPHIRVKVEPEPKEHEIVRVIRALERTGTGFKVFVFFVILVIALSGWLSHLFTLLK